MAAGHEMRISDAEREAAAAELREHFASGRLDHDELNERLDRVFAAKTRGDLNGLFADLPSSGPGWDRATAGAAASGRGAGAGPFGATPGSWQGPFPGSRDAQSQWQSGGGGPRGAGPFLGRLVFTGALLSVLLVVGILGAFGFGTGRPIGFVLIFAAFALLRRLLFGIFGRRRTGGRGPGPAPLLAAPSDAHRLPGGNWLSPRVAVLGSATYRGRDRTSEANGKCDGDALLRSLSRWRRRTRAATGTARAAHRGRGTRRRCGGPWRALRGWPADPRRTARTPGRGTRREDVRAAHQDHGRPARTRAAAVAHRARRCGTPACRASGRQGWRAACGARRRRRWPISARGNRRDRRWTPTGRAGSPRFRCCCSPCCCGCSPRCSSPGTASTPPQIGPHGSGGAVTSGAPGAP